VLASELLLRAADRMRVVRCGSNTCYLIDGRPASLYTQR
jgi:hypothetical protein